MFEKMINIVINNVSLQKRGGLGGGGGRGTRYLGTVHPMLPIRHNEREHKFVLSPSEYLEGNFYRSFK